MITRTADWKCSLAGLPLEVEITDSRGTVVSRNALKISAAGFDEVAYTSPAGGAHRNLPGVRLPGEGREQTGNAGQHFVQGAGVRARPHEGTARSERPSGGRLAAACRRQGSRQRGAPVSASRRATGAWKEK